ALLSSSCRQCCGGGATGVHMTTAQDGCPVWHGPMERGDNLPPMAVYEEMATQRALGPVLRAGEGEGYYLLTRPDDTLRAFQRPELYSSRRLQAGVEMPFALIPIMLDPPEHTKWRKALGSYFTPKRAEEMRPRVREIANDLIDSIVERGECDFVADFSSRF